MNFMNDNEDEWFVIKDFHGFVEKTRILVFNSYGNKDKRDDEDIIDKMIDISASEKDELDQILSYNESSSIIKSLIKKQRNKKTEETRYVLNNKLYIDIIQSLGDRMTSNILHSLVKKGLVEMAFDDEANDFIFWIKDNEQEQPETD